jgi:hypothetical protein
VAGARVFGGDNLGVCFFGAGQGIAAFILDLVMQLSDRSPSRECLPSHQEEVEALARELKAENPGQAVAEGGGDD